MKAAAIARAAKSLRKDVAQRSTTEDPVPKDSNHLAEAYRAGKTIHLTHRQREVLFLLCEGLSNKVIARRLKISSGTVKVHISNILKALRVSTRLQAVLVARCWQLVHETASDALRGRNNHGARHR
jgi:DNA-binding NarL/FixJ family response regulator